LAPIVIPVAGRADSMHHASCLRLQVDREASWPCSAPTRQRSRCRALSCALEASPRAFTPAPQL
jgi:hypothetical protein